MRFRSYLLLYGTYGVAGRQGRSAIGKRCGGERLRRNDKSQQGNSTLHHHLVFRMKDTILQQTTATGLYPKRMPTRRTRVWERTQNVGGRLRGGALSSESSWHCFRDTSAGSDDTPPYGTKHHCDMASVFVSVNRQTTMTPCRRAWSVECRFIFLISSQHTRHHGGGYCKHFGRSNKPLVSRAIQSVTRNRALNRWRSWIGSWQRWWFVDVRNIRAGFANNGCNMFVRIRLLRSPTINALLIWLLSSLTPSPFHQKCNDWIRPVSDIKQLLRRIRALEIASANVQHHCIALSKRRKELVSSLEATSESNKMLLDEVRSTMLCENLFSNWLVVSPHILFHISIFVFLIDAHTLYLLVLTSATSFESKFSIIHSAAAAAAAARIGKFRVPHFLLSLVLKESWTSVGGSFTNIPNNRTSGGPRAIMTVNGYTLDDRQEPNRHFIWITGGSIEPNNLLDEREWKHLFRMHPPKHGLAEKAKLLTVKLLMDATIS